jgi:hypothetical protein
VLVTLSLKTLLDLSDEPGELPGGEPVPAEVARRLACDSMLTRLVLDPLEGGVVDLGRSSRHPSAKQRRRLEERDQGCRFPACERVQSRCHAHHIVWWNEGGLTDENSMLLLCDRHHKLVHEGRWSVALNADNTVTWTTPTGRIYQVAAPRATATWTWLGAPFPRADRRSDLDGDVGSARIPWASGEESLVTSWLDTPEPPWGSLPNLPTRRTQPAPAVALEDDLPPF